MTGRRRDWERVAAGCMLPSMTEKRPAPKPEDDTYSAEETARRRDATVRAMIRMKPRAHKDEAKPRDRRASDSNNHKDKK